jgi:hypothetical protein
VNKLFTYLSYDEAPAKNVWQAQGYPAAFSCALHYPVSGQLFAYEEITQPENAGKENSFTIIGIVTFHEDSTKQGRQLVSKYMYPSLYPFSGSLVLFFAVRQDTGKRATVRLNIAVKPACQRGHCSHQIQLTALACAK